MEYNLTEKFYSEFVKTNKLDPLDRYQNYKFFVNHLLSCFPSQKINIYVDKELENGAEYSHVAGELLEIALAKGYM